MKDQLRKIFADMTTTSSPCATGLQADEINITESPASYDTMYGQSWAGPRRRSLPSPGVPLSLRVHHRLHRPKYPLQGKVAILLTHRATQPIALIVIPLTTGLMIVRIEDHHPVGQVTLIWFQLLPRQVHLIIPLMK